MAKPVTSVKLNSQYGYLDTYKGPGNAKADGLLQESLQKHEKMILCIKKCYQTHQKGLEKKREDTDLENSL